MVESRRIVWRCTFGFLRYVFGKHRKNLKGSGCYQSQCFFEDILYPHEAGGVGKGGRREVLFALKRQGGIRLYKLK